MSNPSERGTGSRSSVEGAERSGVWGGGCTPYPENFCISYQNGEFLYIPTVIFIDTNFQKGHPNQTGGCPDTPLIRSCSGTFSGQFAIK